MKLRIALTVALLAAASAAPLTFADEPYIEFVKGLRDRDYHDFAILYLEQLEDRDDVPADIKAVIPFEKAVTLLDGASQLRNPEAQARQLDQARSLLDQFLKASPNHPNAAQAGVKLAQVVVDKGKLEVLRSKSPNYSGQKAELQKKAREHFVEARKVYQAAHDRFQAEYEKFDKFIPASDKTRYEAREAAYVNWIQTQLNLATLIYEEAQTYDKGSLDNKRLLTQASNAFEQIHTRHRSLVAGLHARMLQGKCYQEQDDITKAVGIYRELLQHVSKSEKPTPALKRLTDRVLQFELICLNHDKRKDYDLVIEQATAWIKDNHSLLSTREGLGIQWELIRAEEMRAKKEGISDAEHNRLLQHALSTARSINRFPGEYKDVSTAMIQRLSLALNRETGDPRDFATAFGIARTLIEDIRNRNQAIAEAQGAEREKLLADLQPLLKEAARMLKLGLALATTKDDEKDVNRARYFLSYVYYSLRDYSYDAAILGEYIARKHYESQPELALDAGYLAQAAYIQAYNRAPEPDRAAEVQRIIDICNFITEHWPENDKAHDARMNLGSLFSQMRQPAEAARWYMQVPEAAPQFLEAQLAAGNAFWFTYLEESIRPEAERKPKAELDELLNQARGILESAIGRYENQLPKEIDLVDPLKLTKLIEAKLTYAQILNGSGDYVAALKLLTDGPLSVAAAVAPPEGAETTRPPKPALRSREFASFAHQQILRSYVGAQDLDKARGEMKELERIEGAHGGGAALTRIYLDLGKELEKEVQRLQTARDPRLGEVLKSFETFLDDMAGRKEGQDYHSLMWVAETWRALGEGLEAGDSTRAAAYFSRAGSALQTILDAEGKSPGFVPEGALTGVQIRRVATLRRQQSFEEARKLVMTLLEKLPKLKVLNVQFEAARVYQDWALSGEDDKWDLAINGDPRAKSDFRAIWGWQGIAQRLNTNLISAAGTDQHSEFEQQYLDARYNIGWCRFHQALAEGDAKKRSELLEQSKADVLVVARLNPGLGGEETWEKFNALYRDIQQQMVSAGIQREAVASLDRTARPTEKPGKPRAVANGKKKSGKPAASRKTSAAAPAKSSDGAWGWIAAAVIVLCGGGATIYFTLIHKPRQPAFRSFLPEALGDPPESPATTRTKIRGTSQKQQGPSV